MLSQAATFADAFSPREPLSRRLRDDVRRLSAVRCEASRAQKAQAAAQAGSNTAGSAEATAVAITPPSARRPGPWDLAKRRVAVAAEAASSALATPSEIVAGDDLTARLTLIRRARARWLKTRRLLRARRRARRADLDAARPVAGGFWTETTTRETQHPEGDRTMTTTFQMLNRQLFEPVAYAFQLRTLIVACWIAGAATQAHAALGGAPFSNDRPTLDVADRDAAAPREARTVRSKVERDDAYWLGGAVAVSLIAPAIML